MRTWTFILLLILWPGERTSGSELRLNSPRRLEESDLEEEEIVNNYKLDKSERMAQMRANIFGFDPQNVDPYFPPLSLSTPTSSPSTTAAAPSSSFLPFSTTTSSSLFPRRTPGLLQPQDTAPSTFSSRNSWFSKDQVAKPIPERSIWEIIWEAHIYFSGTLFVILALYCVINILRIHTFSRLFSRGYFIALNLCLMAVGILRPILLFLDPYNENGSLTRAIAYLLMDTAYPCITTSFAVLFLALLRATQIELVSPAFQTPKALGIFCGIHFFLSFGVDITIGLLFSLRYLVLLCQGFFIVWSLLLSAGYFYIFSPMNKMAMRVHNGDYARSIYPKLMLDGHGGVSIGHPSPGCSGVNGVGSFGHRNNSSANNGNKKPPLARAVRLTLGVAILGSFMGGVELFAMIKMLGLFKQDMNSNHNEWAWHGYQVSMRILEVMICSLLAVIATTPLMSDPENTAEMNLDSPWWKCGCCCRGRNLPREFEDEIYSEICSNNQSVRQVPLDNGTCLQLGTLNGSALALSTVPTMTNTIQINAPRRHHTGTISRTSGVYQDFTRGSGTYQSGSVTSSRATLDTALYSNIRSRPSSMLFNDSGFVRFRMGGDPELTLGSSTHRSTQDLAFALEKHKSDAESKKVIPKRNTTTKEQRDILRSSQSFDETVMLMGMNEEDGKPNSSATDGNGVKSPTSSQSSSSPTANLLPLKSQTQQEQQKRIASPIYKSIDSDSEEPELAEMIYEAPQDLIIPAQQQLLQQQHMSSAVDSSDMESVYGRGYNRAPSVCSSVSATQSFDMRLYGRTLQPSSGNANSKVSIIKFGTVRKNEEIREKLENPYYYYGSTRAQKTGNKKPRPLLPSQRLEFQQQQQQLQFLNSSRPSSRQALLGGSNNSSSTKGLIQKPRSPNFGSNIFQRSRSLGHHYGTTDRVVPPTRNAEVTRFVAAGSMTPVSYAKWRREEEDRQKPKRHNPLYDTPPANRHEYSFNRGGEIREVMGTPPQPRLVMPIQQQPRFRAHQPPPILSPILTDHEASPSHKVDGQRPTDYLTDNSEDEDRLGESQGAGGGYSEGLADNEESEVSSIHGRLNGSKKTSLSPLEYSAMLKLYTQDDHLDKLCGSNAKMQQSISTKKTFNEKKEYLRLRDSPSENPSSNKVFSSSDDEEDDEDSSDKQLPAKKYNFTENSSSISSGNKPSSPPPVPPRLNSRRKSSSEGNTEIDEDYLEEDDPETHLTEGSDLHDVCKQIQQSLASA